MSRDGREASWEEVHFGERSVSGHRFSDAAKTPTLNGFTVAEKFQFDFVLKGRGFKPRRKCHKINPALQVAEKQ
jgi:hypothetical protein